MSSTISLKINLAALQHVFMKSSTDEKETLLVIPVNKNLLYKSDKGNVYLDCIAFPLKEEKDDQSHLVKQSLPKDVREKMSEEQKMKQPIIGSIKVWSGTGKESEPNNITKGEVADGVDDLPF